MTSHRANIFSAKFLPETGDQKIISCSGDGSLLYTDLLREPETAACLFNCHVGTVYETVTIPGDPNTFLSAGEDGTVRWFDLRVKSRCSADLCREDVLISCDKAVTAISLNPLLSYQIAVGCSDSKVRIFDRRQLGTQSTGHQPDTTGLNGLVSRFSVPEFGDKMRRLTCVSWRPDGQELLASYSSDYIYIFDPNSDSEEKGKKLKVGNPERKSTKRRNKSPQPVKKLRLRGDWSDTGPNSRPETEARQQPSVVGEERESESQQGPAGQASLMQRMTDALSRMLNDPSTRQAMQRLNSQGEGMEMSGNENREPRQERQDLGQGRETRAAAAIQGTWRRYRQRRAEMEDEEETQTTENVPTVTEQSKSCSPKVLCCGSNRGGGTEDQAEETTGCDNDSDDNMVELEDSVADLTERSGVEPSVELRYGETGGRASTVTAVEALPGPSRVVTGPVQTGQDPVTGARRRRSGISSVPTSAILPDTNLPGQPVRNIVEYETSDDSDGDLGDGEEQVGFEEENEGAASDRVIKQPGVLQQLTGHRNARTMIKEAAWWGTRFILSGSDCGHMFAWDRETGHLVMLLEADRHVVNCVQPHPTDPILATSGEFGLTKGESDLSLLTQGLITTSSSGVPLQRRLPSTGSRRRW